MASWYMLVLNDLIEQKIYGIYRRSVGAERNPVKRLLKRIARQPLPQRWICFSYRIFLCRVFYARQDRWEDHLVLSLKGVSVIFLWKSSSPTAPFYECSVYDSERLV